RGPEKETTPAEFPGLQHTCRLGHLYVRHVEHLADSRRLLAEREGTAEMAGGRGRRPGTVAPRVSGDRRGQDPPRNHHARDVRSLARLRRDVAKTRPQFRGTF